MSELFTSILYYPIGYAYLWLRFRNKKKVKTALNEKYNNSYYEAGAIFSLTIFGVILFVLLSFFLIAVIIGFIRSPIPS